MPNPNNLNTGSAAERRAHARVAAFTRWAFEPDRSAATAPARRGLDEKFLRDADPDGVLSEHDRAVRAEALRRAHFLRMALRSAQSRRRRAARVAGQLATDDPPAA